MLFFSPSSASFPYSSLLRNRLEISLPCGYHFVMGFFIRLRFNLNGARYGFLLLLAGIKLIYDLLTAYFTLKLVS